MCGNFGLLVFNTVIGLLVASVGYTPFFVAMAVLDLIAAAVLWSLVRPPADADQPHPERL